MYNKKRIFTFWEPKGNIVKDTDGNYIMIEGNREAERVEWKAPYYTDYFPSNIST